MTPDLDPRLAPYQYHLPDDRIARFPPADRDGGRLLLLTGPAAVDARIPDLPAQLRAGDLLVINDTRVMPARVPARRATGGRVELLFLEPGDPQGRARVMARPGRRLKSGETLEFEERGFSVVLEERHADGTWTVRALPTPLQLMETLGHMPLPPYIDRPDGAADRRRYQTVYADQMGAVAAPTAGLHLTDSLLARLRECGVEIARITLHVGPGTFRSLRPQDLDAGLLHPEPYTISEAAAAAVARTRSAGGRVVAVGTTATRTLEAAALPDRTVRAGGGSTRLFIREGYGFQVVDALLTNFHLPQSSLIMLVSAFGGRERVMAAYRHAVRVGYRFYSYGDAMFLTPG